MNQSDLSTDLTREDAADLEHAREDARTLIDDLESLAVSLQHIVNGTASPVHTFHVRGMTTAAGDTVVSASLRIDTLLAHASEARS